MIAAHHSMMGRMSPLPPGVVPLNYVQGSIENYGSNNVPYIKTDIRPTLDFEIEGEFECHTPVGGPWLYYFGVQSGDDSNNQCSFRRWDWQPTSAQAAIGNKSVQVSIPSGKFYLRMNKSSVTVNDSIYTLPTPTVQVYNGLLYFCSSNWRGRATRSSQNLTYWAKVYDGGMLVADLIPVSDNGTPTLYNKKTGYICPANRTLGG